MERMGYPFTPEVALLYNPSATVVSKGEAVSWQGASATPASIEYPEPDASAEIRPTLDNQSSRTTTTRNVPGIVRRTGAPTLLGDICGVAMETISATSWGHVCLSGVVDVRIAVSADIANGDPLVAASAVFAEEANPDSATTIHAMALEATITSGTCAAALISAFLPVRPGALDQLNFSTAVGI